MRGPRPPRDNESEEITWDKPDALLNIEADKLSAELPNGTDREWDLIRKRCDQMRRMNAWVEYRDATRTLAVFYYNDDTGHFQLQKPGPVQEMEMRKRAWSLVRRQTPTEWAELRSHSDVIRNVLHFQEMRDTETGCVFYFDTKVYY